LVIGGVEWREILNGKTGADKEADRAAWRLTLVRVSWKGITQQYKKVLFMRCLIVLDTINLIVNSYVTKFKVNVRINLTWTTLIILLST
jgi:hypothetical protein